jgi:hypothetical protein
LLLLELLARDRSACKRDWSDAIVQTKLETSRWSARAAPQLFLVRRRGLLRRLYLALVASPAGSGGQDAGRLLTKGTVPLIGDAAHSDEHKADFHERVNMSSMERGAAEIMLPAYRLSSSKAGGELIEKIPAAGRDVRFL